MPDTFVNEQPVPASPQPIKLEAADFLLLKDTGALAGYCRSELIEGQLWGAAAEDGESGAKCPIKLRIEDYERLSEAGAFERYRKTELIDGIVYAMNPHHRPHGFARDELFSRLREALKAIGSPLHAAAEQSVSLPPHGEPQPDIILTTEPRGPGAIPGSSVALIVEIATSNPTWDLGEMLRVYAAASIGEYWVLDLKKGRISQMWSPQGEAYARRREVKLGARIEAVTIEGLAAETAGIN
ncbi:MAG TPA: Uma2 family endonuclease [Allosphingosinicella sp.]|nr:Uma2 family endonuclease [Allosphingosinicella sp.]